MLSQRKKNIEKSIEIMFAGLEQEDLKQVMLAIALDKSEEEKEEIAERIRKEKEADLAYIQSRFELESALEAVGDTQVIVKELNDVTILSNDNIDERNISSELNQGHKSTSFEHAKDIVYS